MQTAYNNCNFFLLASLAGYLYLRFWICSTALVSSVTVCNWKPTFVFRVNKLVREKVSFCPTKSEKNQRKWILYSSRNHAGILADLRISYSLCCTVVTGQWPLYFGIRGPAGKLVPGVPRWQKTALAAWRYCLITNNITLILSVFHQEKRKICKF